MSKYTELWMLDQAARFIKNFAKYTTNEAGKALVAVGPKL